MNNSGIYGGDRRQQQLREAAHKGAKAAGFGDDPEPTSFVPDAKYAIAATLFISCAHDRVLPCASELLDSVFRLVFRLVSFGPFAGIT